MDRSFAIGDIHGCNKTFQKLLLDKLRIKKSDNIYCLGDYIDRGNDSKGVIDFILDLREQGYQIHTIRGNHEQMMLDSTIGDKNLYLWMVNGGGTTLQSFGITSFNEMPLVYRNFFISTEYYIRTDNYILVHAGLNLNLKDPFDDKYSMLWYRILSVDEHKLGDHILLHGHNPLSLYYILKQQNTKVINIDGGCVFKPYEQYGYLVAYDMNRKDFIYLENIDIL